MVNYDNPYLRQIAGQEIANPGQAFAQGGQAGNLLFKISQGREADALTPAAVGGDKNALARLSGLDFNRAKSITDTTYQHGRDAAADSRAAASEGRAAEEFKWKQQAQNADAIARLVFSATTPEAFEQAKVMLKARGVQGAENFTFADRDGLIASAKSLKDQAESGKPIEVSAGASLMKPTGEVIGTAPPNPGANKPTEAAVRNGQLFSVAAPELGIVNETFSSLTDASNQILAKAGVPGNFVTSAPYQRAKGAISTIIATYLYSVSGATANPGEVANQTEILTPRLGEKPDAVADKLRRINTMVNSIKMGARGADSGPAGAVAPPPGPQGGSGPSQAEIEAEMRRRGILK